MNLDNLNELPEWDDDEFNEEDTEGEEWKPSVTTELCKAMYKQWNTVMLVLKAAFDSMKDPTEDSLFNKEYLEDQKEMILGDAYEVAAKIRSSEVGLYIIRMENAAMIRKNAQFIKISTNNFIEDDLMEAEHRLIIRQEIDAFRELFKQWVKVKGLLFWCLILWCLTFLLLQQLFKLLSTLSTPLRAQAEQSALSNKLSTMLRHWSLK